MASTLRQLTGIQEVFAAIDEYQSYIKQGIGFVFLLFYSFIALFALLVGYLLSRRLTSPLLRLVEGTRIVADGDLEHQLEISSTDEIGQLMSSFNQMITRIKENQQLAQERELERQRNQGEHELVELRARALQAENERQTVELMKSQELE
ncbi:MAG: HAMP domain-containing protein [Candidatus Latescibacterota bacterium]